MSRRIVVAVLMLAGFGVWASAGAAQERGSVTGQVMDLACYVGQGVTTHAECPDRLAVKNGQPMGLLTDDGTLVLLVADRRNPAPYHALKDLAGEKVHVTGTLAERGGMKVFTVEGSRKR